MTRDEEDRLVVELLEAAEAAEAPSGPERKGHPSLDAYRALARSRGVDLEVVLRAVVRDELRDIAAMPPVTPNRGGPVADLRAVEGDGDGTSCRVVR